VHDRLEESVSYFDQVSAISPLEEPKYAPVSALAHFNFGTNLMSHGDFERAAQQFSTAIKLEPGNADYHIALSVALAKQGKPDEAMAELNSAAQHIPTNPEIQAHLAALCTRQHKTKEAIAHYRETVRLYRVALEHDPDSPALLNNLAWILAANPNDEIRNGADAVKLARHACEVTHWKEAVHIGTLAAACAEAGQFDEAVNMARKAKETAIVAGQKEIAARNEELSKLYLAKKAYRDDGN
jgi:tetratricopeptide (TPR) repeat protein